jgi:hypothetical protein
MFVALVAALAISFLLAVAAVPEPDQGAMQGTAPFVVHSR